MTTVARALTSDGVVLFRMSSTQFATLPVCERKLELLDGEVVMAAQPRFDHQDFVGGLLAELRAWVRAGNLGRVAISPGVRLAEGWTPAPDIVFVATARLASIGDDIDGPVDLAVEILSPSNTATDRVTKFEAYARYGVGWYWIVDLEARALEEYENAGGAFRLLATVPFSVPFQPRLFPGLTIDLAAIL
jgi:Uma2 family endonuclease